MRSRYTLKSASVFLPAGVLIGVTLAVALTSVAEDTELDTGPRAIPYNGLLKFNDQVVQGQVDLQFTLTDDPTGANVNCEFIEEHDNVTAYSGRFSVNIGAVAGDLPDCVFDSDAMYIQVGVRDATANEDDDDTNDGYAALSGAQRIHPVPFAYWAAEGSDLKVDGALRVSGDIEDPSDGVVTINDDLVVTGSLLGSTDGLVEVRDDVHVSGQAYVFDVGDASLAADGLVTLGLTTSANMTLGPDEIIARRDGAHSTLYLQEDGGRVEARGDLVVHGALSGADDVLTIDDSLGLTGDILNLNGDTVTVHDSLSVSNRLFINDIDVNADGTDGCARIGEMQICWETFFSTNVGSTGSNLTFNWSRPFLNTEYAVTANVSRAINSSFKNGVSLYGKETGSITANCVQYTNGFQTVCQGSTGEDDLQISLLAIGRAGDDW